MGEAQDGIVRSNVLCDIMDDIWMSNIKRDKKETIRARIEKELKIRDDRINVLVAEKIKSKYK